MGRLIGLCGPAGAGKDEAAQALVADGWERVAFADRMRAGLLALNPWLMDPAQRLATVVSEIGWDEAKRKYPEVRRLLQAFGTEAGRDIHGQNCWVDLVLKADRDGDTVITDVRFINEAVAVKMYGGTLVRIDRPGLEPLPGGHTSEAGIPDRLIDYTIQNTGDVADLHHMIRDLTT